MIKERGEPLAGADRLDGVGFIHKQMARQPTPIVVVSVASESGEGSTFTIRLPAVVTDQRPGEPPAVGPVPAATRPGERNAEDPARRR